MAPPISDDGVDYRAKFQDALLSNSALTDGLTDDEAKPLIDWAMRQAEFVGSSVADEVDADDKLSNLTRLILYISRFTQGRSRHTGDAEWFQKQVEKMNRASTELGGSVMDMTTRQKLKDSSQLSNPEMLRLLMGTYSNETATRPMTNPTIIPDTDPHLDAADLNNRYLEALDDSEDTSG
jgi:hypothetical protein